MSRVGLSEHAVAAVTRHLRRLGHSVMQPDRRHARLIVDGFHTVEVRAAHWYRRRHSVLVKGKRYRYVYPARCWNLSVRGRLCPCPWRWVLLTAGEPVRRAIVAPGRLLGGKTYSLVGDGTHAAARVADYRGAWGRLAPRRKAAA